MSLTLALALAPALTWKARRGSQIPMLAARSQWGLARVRVGVRVTVTVRVTVGVTVTVRV